MLPVLSQGRPPLAARASLSSLTFRCLLTLPLLCGVLPAQAEEISAADSERIVVIGSSLPLPPGTPAYGQVEIGRDRLTGTASGRVEDALKDIAGFGQFRRSDSRSANPSAQGANLRGIGGNASSRSLLVLDGVPMADPFFGYQPYSAIVPERLAGIRVTRGASTGSFGAGAVAGIIEMASATRADLPLLTASGFYGSRDASELAATFSPDVGAGYVSISGRWDRGDGFYTTPDSQRVAASVPAGYDSWSTSLRAVVPVSDTLELQGRALIYNDDRSLRFAGADSHAEGQDVALRLLSRGRWQWEALAYVQARNFSNIVISASSFRKSLDQRNTPALGLGGKFELRPPVGSNHLLRLGVDARHASGDMFENAYNANSPSNPLTFLRHATGRQLDMGAYAEDDWTLGDIVLSAGVRADRWTITEGRYESRNASTNVLSMTAYPDRSGWEAGGRLGLLWHASPALSVRGSVYSGFRLPTLNELYRSYRVGLDATAPNADLIPERLRGAEVGIDLSITQGVQLGGTFFVNRLDNAISNVSLGTATIATGVISCLDVGTVQVGGTCRQRRNVDAIEAVGVELFGQVKLGAVRLDGSYAYIRSRVVAPGTALDRMWPAQTPRHMASATLAYAPAHGPQLSATLRYGGKQYEDDLNSDTLPSTLTVDAVASLPLRKGVSLVVRGENLFDEQIITRNAGGSIDLGAPRTLWIGVKLAH